MNDRQPGTIRCDISVESPFCSKYVSKQHAIGSAWQSAMRIFVSSVVGILFRNVSRQRVVCCHKALHSRLPHTHFECRQIILTHVLLRHKRGCRLSSLLIIVCSKVLGTCHEFIVWRCRGNFSLESTHKLHSESSCQEWVFAIILLIASPTRVARHINGWRPVVQAFPGLHMIYACFV